MEMNKQLHQQIVKLCEEGDQFAELKQMSEAIASYQRALELVPEPKEKWSAATWIYGTLGDTYFLIKNYEDAIRSLEYALRCPDGNENPFLLLRLGESFYELGEFEKAKAYLYKAYQIEDYKIFFQEDDKYFKLIIELI
ncbi:tetratricopeptide repeat protein [Priestia aryabhattai]|uniref:tetratricopeptide repeat protein n=1 Tax=Priestia aryabhattai TaxID=412384 RepID=UPI003D283EBE